MLANQMPTRAYVYIGVAQHCAGAIFQSTPQKISEKEKNPTKHLVIPKLFPTFALANEGETYSANGEIAQLVRASDS